MPQPKMCYGCGNVNEMAPTSVPMPVRRAMAGTGTMQLCTPSPAHSPPAAHHRGFQRHLLPGGWRQGLKAASRCSPLLLEVIQVCRGSAWQHLRGLLCQALCDPQGRGDVSNPCSCFKCHSIPRGTSQKTEWTASIRAG